MWFPEELWREIKSFFLVPEFYVGDFIYGIPNNNYRIQQHYNNFISRRGGIVVNKTGKYKNATYYISVAEFGGDYLVLSHNGLSLHKKSIKPLDKIILINSFGNWWYSMHKTVFQELLIQTII